MSNTLADYIRNGPRYTLLGDTNHNDPGLRAYLSSETFFNELRQAGVRHLFLEAPRNHTLDAFRTVISLGNFSNTAELQQRIDERIREGKRLAPELYRNPSAEVEMRQYYQQLGLANLYGLAVHYMDHDTTIDPQRIGQASGGQRDTCYQSFANTYAGRNVSTPQEALEYSRHGIMMRERMLHDDSIAQAIRSESPDGRSVVIIGNAHLTHSQGLQTHLGGEAQALALFSNAAQRQSHLQMMYNNAYLENFSAAGTQQGYMVHSRQFIMPNDQERQRILDAARREIPATGCTPPP